MTANGGYAQHCYELVEEKLLETDLSEERKRDCLPLLSLACSRFDPSDLVHHVDGIWDALRVKALNPNDSAKECSSELLTALRNLVETINRRTIKSGYNSELVVLIEKICSGCEPFVLQAETGVAPRALSMLEAVARVNSDICGRVAGKVVLWLMELAQGSSINSVNRVEIAEQSTPRLADWVTLVVRMQCQNSVLNGRIPDALLRLCVDKFCRETSPIIIASGFRLAATLLSSQTLAQDEQTAVSKYGEDLRWLFTTAVKVVGTFASTGGGDKVDEKRNAARNNALRFLRCLAELHRALVSDMPPINGSVDKDLLARDLLVCAHMATDAATCSALFDQESGPIGRVILATAEDSSSSADVGEALQVIPIPLGLNQSESGKSDVIEYFVTKMPRLLLDATVMSRSEPCLDQLQLCLQEISILLEKESLVRYSKNLMDMLVDVIRKDESSQRLATLTFRSVALALLSVPLETADELASTLEKVSSALTNPGSSSSSDVEVNSLLFQLRSSLVNKLDDSSKWREKLEKLRNEMGEQGGSGGLAALCRALMVANRQPEGVDTVEQLFASLPGGATACRLLFDFSSPQTDPQRCRYRTTLLWKQRYLTQTSDVFLKHFYQSKKDRDNLEPYFVILGDMLRFSDTIEGGTSTTLAKLRPVVVSAVLSAAAAGGGDSPTTATSSGLSDASIQLVLNSFKTMLCRQGGPPVATSKEENGYERQEEFTKLCTALVGILEEQQKRSTTNTLSIRLAVVQCLQALASPPAIVAISPAMVSRVKRPVLRVLASAAADRKRVVRRAAAEAVNRWELLDA